MTVATITSTVTAVVEAKVGTYDFAQYAPAVAEVSEALAQREYDIVDAIAEAANEQYGVSKHEVATILHNAGLAERPKPVAVPEPEAEEPVTADVAGKLSKSERIAKLEEGQAAILTALGNLTALAKRHLGADL